MAAARHFAYAHAKNTRAVDRGGRELGRCLGWLCWCVLIVTDSNLTGLKKLHSSLLLKAAENRFPSQPSDSRFERLPIHHHPRSDRVKKSSPLNHNSGKNRERPHPLAASSSAAKIALPLRGLCEFAGSPRVLTHRPISYQLAPPPPTHMDHTPQSD